MQTAQCPICHIVYGWEVDNVTESKRVYWWDAACPACKEHPQLKAAPWRHNGTVNREPLSIRELSKPRVMALGAKSRRPKL